MKKLIILVNLSIIFTLPGFSQHTSAELVADVEQLVDLIETKHVWPYRLVTKADFRAQVEAATRVISSQEQCDESCYVEVLKIVAALNDGHSVVRYNTREQLFGYLPLTVTWFKEGLYVTRVAEEHQYLLGAKLSAINDVTIDEVLEQLEEVIPHGNHSRFKKFAYSYLRMPGLLYGLGITDDPSEAQFTFLLENETTLSVRLQHMTDEVYERTNFLSYSDINPTTPLYSQNSSAYYWSHYDAENRIFYFKYNRIGNMDSQRASDFAAHMWARVDSLEVDKFVLDIRNNGGGQFAYSMSFLQGILDRPKINKSGKLFIISGYDTFSATLDMLRNLEVKSEALIIGEPPGDYAASSGDPKEYILDNTEIEVELSSVFHPTVFTNDMREELILDEIIELSWTDYQNGSDAAYNYVVDYGQEKLPTVPPEKYRAYWGTYRYDEDKHVQIKAIDDLLFLEISKSLRSPLYLIEDRLFATEIQGMTVELDNAAIQINFPDGQVGTFEKIAAGKSALEQLYAGNFAAAKEVYLQIKKDQPDSQLIRDGRFSNLALFAFFELRATDRELASTIAKGILNLGIEINDGNAPFCEFALRFY